MSYDTYTEIRLFRLNSNNSIDLLEFKDYESQAHYGKASEIIETKIGIPCIDKFLNRYMEEIEMAETVWHDAQIIIDEMAVEPHIQGEADSAMDPIHDGYVPLCSSSYSRSIILLLVANVFPLRICTISVLLI